MTGEKLVLVEHKQNLKAALDYLKSDKNTVIVAASPDVVCELEALGEKFALIEDYYSDEELMKHCATEGYAFMDRVCDYIDAKAAGIIFDSSAPLPLAKGNYYDLKVVLDAVYSRVIILRRMMEKSRAKEIIYFFTARERIPEELYFDDESVYSRLLETVFSKTIRCEALRGARQSVGRTPALAAKKFLKANVRYAVNTLKRCAEYLMSSASRKKIILDCVTDHDAKLTLDTLKGQFRIINAAIYAPHPYFGGASADIKLKTAALWKCLSGDAEFAKLFTVEGVNFFAVVAERLERLVTVAFAATLSWRETFKNAFKRTAGLTVAAITSNNSSYVPKALSYVCREYKVPFIEFQHGGVGYFEFPMHYYDNLRYGDYFFSYGGDGLKNHYTQKYGADARKIIPVGSPMLDELSRQSAKAGKTRGPKPLIIYAPTNMMKQRRYFSYHALADNTYYLFQKKLIDMFSSLKGGFEFIVKLHPNTSVPASPITEYIERIKAANIRIEREGYLSKYLLSADGLVIDSPTTVLLQGMAAGNAVFVINNVLKITPEANALLKKEVYMAESVEELRENLSSAFSPDGKSSRPAGAAGVFLREYGTSGDSVKRAAGELKALIGVK